MFMGSTDTLKQWLTNKLPETLERDSMHRTVNNVFKKATLDCCSAHIKIRNRNRLV